ncbi:polysaccharide pyruvyl transferase family protein [Psychroserpens sp. XS_ASV72]|uniref:polysaccharide pyruvyl transferase family protein n=1 Tax=Psychroserpens sp. XS_ASV72 TaxID=3241293 RepID=UPI003514A9B0
MFKLHVYWHSMNRNDGKENYGDALAPYICSKLSGKVVTRVNFIKSKKYKYLFKHYFTIGSIIKRVTEKSIVWGSGIIKVDEQVANAKFLAVRGPRTRKRLLELGYDVPENYGDPALLLPQFIANDVEKKYKLGIIPHFVDHEKISEIFKNHNDIAIINLITNDVVETTHKILQCESIISSSLHGVIVSHTYSIPALWLKFSNSLSGDNVKFYDYFESVGIDYNKEFVFDKDLISEKALLDLLQKHTDLSLPDKDVIAFRREQLLSTCPFYKKNGYI